ncbi:MAG: type II secretion system F family protein [Spartobacteria bacterium]|nr:type II secretion system F family protein [Spartobacteria bacterium]
MAKFDYAALDINGKEKRGTVEAESQTAALGKVRKQGLFPTSVTPAAKGKINRHGGTRKVGGKKGSRDISIRMPHLGSGVSGKQLMAFTRQLSILVNAGLPLLKGLQVIGRQEKNPVLNRTIAELAESIQGGSTLGEAMATHPKVFNRLYVNMVKAGEIGGILDQILERLSEFMEKAQAIKSKVISAMVYPLVVLIMALGIVTFLLIFIIPKFQAIFDDLLGGAALPPLTQFIMNLSSTFKTRGPFIFGGMAMAVVIIKIIGKTKKGRYALDSIILKMPLFGTLLSRTAIARFSRTLGTLMIAGVPVLQALLIVRDTAGNAVLARAAENLHESVKEGENMSPQFEVCGVFPPLVVSMVEVGEETGSLPEMMVKVADTYDQEVDSAVTGLTSAIEPLLIIFLAVVVGTIVIALFQPLISIIGKLGG